MTHTTDTFLGYSPVITFMSYIFYAAYGALMLLPLVLQIVGEWRFKRLARD